MQCIYCKKQVPSDALVCPHCGKALVLDASLLPTDALKEAEPEKEVVREEPIQERKQEVKEEQQEQVVVEPVQVKQEEPVREEAKQERKEERVKQKPKRGKFQFGKIIMILCLTAVSICSFILLKVVTPEAAVELINKIKADPTLRVINYILLLIPTLLIFILGQLGWGLIMIIAGITILSCLLVMIKATKTKKFILLGIIALNVALIISAIIMYWH